MAIQITKIFKKKKASILERWMQNQLAHVGLREDLISNDDLRADSSELIVTLLDTLNEKNLDDPDSSDFDPVVELLNSLSLSRARQGFSPRETGLFIIGLKEVLIGVLQEEIIDHKELADLSLKVHRLLDNFSISTFEAYIKGREEVILRQTDEIAEISTPVIRVWDGILALPIIGTLDSARTQVIMETLLTEIVESGSSIAILDISGVPTVDSLVAQHLLKTVSATRLMGAECIISGIRPEIAQTIVHLGIDLATIITKSTLASALQHAFKSLRLEVRQQRIDSVLSRVKPQ
ncbi:STAS domain-containing protein [Parapedobacter indicus]|uniref:RsbT co-antagonist protein RsbR n=1 Tax=Parapedobacter indicus TaxID=1477437 RepID=A0A1I3U991_9SPHI|nr:STAS domain-containing protein [Parapedobacter indicus]PPK99169.1 rsbT co-antagonist protein RsbR [Parapedobacter indicus]SFJ78426.1 rsbT co-antagonist protein RsbR [Parapedobacter indicus]